MDLFWNGPVHCPTIDCQHASKFTLSSSPNICLLSECPNITHLPPISFIISGLKYKYMPHGW